MLALAAITALPWLIWHDYAVKQQLRDSEPAQRVPVVATHIDEENPGYSEITVSVGGREVTIGPPHPPPDVGDEIAVVVDPQDPTHVLLAENPDARAQARDDAFVASVLALSFITLIGWGPGLPPRRALRSLRRPGATNELTQVRVLAVQRRRPPQGLIYDHWRKMNGSEFYELHLAVTGAQTVVARDGSVLEAGPLQGAELIWHGHAYDEPVAGSELVLVGGHAPGEWGVLVRDDRGAWRLLWPVVPLREAAPAQAAEA